MNNLVTILSRFRLGKVAVMGDIAAMYHQVKVPEKEQDSLRFLWRDSDKEDVADYVMTVHLFGKTDSPCVANWALRKSVEDASEKIKEAVENHFYMDDFLDSCDTVEESLVLIEVLGEKSFKLTKWISNSTEVLLQLPHTKVKDSQYGSR